MKNQKVPLKISENNDDFRCSFMDRMQQYFNIWQSNISAN